MGKEIEEPDIVFDFAESRAREKLATGMISDCNIQLRTLTIFINNLP